MPRPHDKPNVFQRMLEDATHNMHSDECEQFYEQVIVALCYELDNHGRDVPRVLQSIIEEKRS